MIRIRVPEQRTIHIVLVLLVAGITYFSGLDAYPLLDPDEGRYAEIPREMLESGDFITPRLNYVKYFEKPPLFYWLTAVSMAVFGQNEWAVRLVPALAGMLTLLLVMAMGRKMFGPRTGIMSGWIYLTSLLPTVLARLPIIDGVFSLFLSATWASWWLGYSANRRRSRHIWYCLFWACLGLAVMTKGIAAIALTGLIVLGVIICRRDWRALGSMVWLPGLLIFGLITVPWHWAVESRNPGFLHFYIVIQHFARLVGREHAEPFWFFIAIFPFGMLFWAAFFPATISRAIRKAIETIKAPSRNCGEGDIIVFLLLWIGGVVGLFSVSSCKLVPYILPAYPAMSLLMAHFITGSMPSEKSVRWGAAIFATLLMAAVCFLTPVAADLDKRNLTELMSAIQMGQGAVLLAGFLFLIALFKGHMIPLATGLALVMLMPVMLTVMPAVAEHRKVGGFIKAISSSLPPEVTIAEWRNYNQALSFYARRRTVLVDERDELAFGGSHGNHEDYFLSGENSIKTLAGTRPLLVNLRKEDWPQVQNWGLLQPVAANSNNVMVGNDAFFRVTGFSPWQNADLIPSARLLAPRLRDGRQIPEPNAMASFFLWNSGAATAEPVSPFRVMEEFLTTNQSFAIEK